MTTNQKFEDLTLEEYRTIIDKYYQLRSDKNYDQPTLEEYRVIKARCHRLRSETFHNFFVFLFDAIKNRSKKIFKISSVEMPKPHFMR